MSKSSIANDSSVTLAPFLVALGDYQKKGVGVDMMLKSVLNIVRLCMIYSTDGRDRRKYFQLADSIIECRMLCNFGRPAMTLSQGLKMFAMREEMEFWHWLFTCLSFFLRVPEQLSGDLNYLQKVVFHSWSREAFSFSYRFFKSLSLTCCVLMELTRRSALQRALRDASTPKQRLHAGLEMRVSNALIVRSLCDMYVYFKWIPSYHPIKTVEFLCGFVSGIVGMWLVWRDTRYVVSPPPVMTAETPIPCPNKDALKRAVCVLGSQGDGSEVASGSGEDG
ncbi:hypothetical protein conserved [Leishmania donovani]|uniref:Uncharacterized protein n=3 Tax=Leishmania donovani species complex TaxID=38574 RepID=A4IC87_LEIIN|nr:conserved hypothetical protein [Leishmania infantum JPCM5]XP_003865770.1 hypothetical protein, conserved [Leishmania donovani]CAC9553143.1 hypothetical_protein_-_conserved [Leishmania infantum]AYU84020.1 hypothetical protein LdCL_360073600 [Leishmania donovani]TPP48770.1 hypothetical protein CGC21_15600 [Leishmania donovani]TPP49516.1 hypothetical protein CGC20_18965 [Leishmania donovani]CAJ1994038.1 hypothetical protein conserved [Leishmania donovani]|eukprot:XP_001469356.1 conserved hypothetical protein [Leishmania infantum JPCM5]